MISADQRETNCHVRMRRGRDHEAADAAEESKLDSPPTARHMATEGGAHCEGPLGGAVTAMLGREVLSEDAIVGTGEAAPA